MCVSKRLETDLEQACVHYAQVQILNYLRMAGAKLLLLSISRAQVSLRWTARVGTPVGGGGVLPSNGLLGM